MVSRVVVAWVVGMGRYAWGNTIFDSRYAAASVVALLAAGNPVSVRLFGGNPVSFVFSGKSGVGSSFRGEIRCRFVFSGKNDELTPGGNRHPGKNDELTPDFLPGKNDELTPDFLPGQE